MAEKEQAALQAGSELLYNQKSIDNLTQNLSLCKQAALFYTSKLHWFIVPIHNINSNGFCSCGNPNCPSSGKHPITRNGLKDASNNPAVIAAWWTRWPNANIGVLCKASGFFVLDVDARHGGVESLYQLILDYGELPPTVTAESGGGGAHFYFEYPRDVEITDRQNIKQGIDIKANGYVLMPPSNHKSGKRYTWRKGCKPTEMAIAKAPDWLLELLQTKQAESRAEEVEQPEWGIMLDQLVEGRRNDSLYRYACRLLSHGLTAVEVVKIIRAINTQYGKPPLPSDEVDKLLISAINWKEV